MTRSERYCKQLGVAKCEFVKGRTWLGCQHLQLFAIGYISLSLISYYARDWHNMQLIISRTECKSLLMDKTPTHMATTHVISKSERNFQNRIPTELDKNFCISRFVVIYWITSNIQIFKIPLYKKVMTILIPGIQPTNDDSIDDWIQMPEILGKVADNPLVWK